MTASQPREKWPWLLLAVGLVVIALARIPLIVNAANHLDSDLAVDGLTLREAVAGHWRWHYPGTPHTGILPVVFSLPQSLIWGAHPVTLVSGGVVAYAALVAATYMLAWRGFGAATAAWCLVPLVFSSTGAIWLSGRLTGGHLTAAAWHAGAFAILQACLARGGRWRAALLGLWCGVGLYVDSMFLLTLAGVVPAAILAWCVSGFPRSGFENAAVFLAALAAGAAPREIGARMDPHDAYRDQFATSLDPEVLGEHARILALDCLPRLICGHRLPGLEADPDPGSLSFGGPASGKRDRHPAAIANAVVGLGLFALAMIAIVVPGSGAEPLTSRAVRWGLCLSALATIAGFIVNLNIFNSDNYRYLADLLVPWSLGFGLAMNRFARRGRLGVVGAAICALLLAGSMTSDAVRWYTRLGWIDSNLRPVRKRLHDPVLDWLGEHRDVSRFLGGYWDVYRLAFLSDRPVRGIPYAIYPDRFPEWSRAIPGGHAAIVIGRSSRESRPFLVRALSAGGRVLLRAGSVVIVSWP